MAMPCTLTTKDLGVIEDQLMHLAMDCRVAETYSNQFTTPALKNMATTLAQHHRAHYDALFAFLNGCQ